MEAQTSVGISGMSKYQIVLLMGLAIVAVLSCVRPIFPREMFLQHIPTVALLVTLPLVLRRLPLSNAAVTCIVAFMLLHVLGARYIYSYVPYDRWYEQLFGLNPTAKFGFQRNHYDRLVHFFFGALWVCPVWEMCLRHIQVPRRFAYYTAFEFVLAFSMLYELLEWGLSITLAPDDANAYNGQQGDMWDAQKDMTCALIGACLAVLVLVVVEWRRAGRRGTSHNDSE